MTPWTGVCVGFATAGRHAIDDGSRAAIAAFEALAAIHAQLRDLGTRLSRRPEVDRREMDWSPLHPSLGIALTLIVDLQSSHAINWSIELWWRDAEWSVVGSQYWTAPFPYDGWRSTWESEQRAHDIAALLSALSQVSGELIARAESTDFRAPETW